MEHHFCTQCGEQLAPGERFCGSCGHAVEASAVAAPPPASAAAVAGLPPAGAPVAGPPPAGAAVAGPPPITHAAPPPAGQPLPAQSLPVQPVPGGRRGPSRGVVIGLGVAVVALVAGLVVLTTRGDDGESSTSSTAKRTTTSGAVATSTASSLAPSTAAPTTAATTVAPEATTTAPPAVEGEVLAVDHGGVGAGAFTPGIEVAPGEPIGVPLPLLELSAPVGSDAGTTLLGAWGDQLGLYGGRRDQPTCDVAALQSFLGADPAAGAAWAGAAGIGPDQGLDQYLNGLTGAALTRDTRLTGYRWLDGAAVPSQIVLRGGSAVLLDGSGLPVVSCADGNPLGPPVPTSVPPTYTPAWPDFAPDLLVAVVPAEVVPVDGFVLVDLVTGEPFRRDPGALGFDRDVDPDIRCALLPDDPTCSEIPGTTPDDPGLAAISALDEQLSICGYTIDEYVDNGPVDGGYSVIAVTPQGEAEFIVRDGYIDVNDQLAADIAVQCGFYQP